MTERSSALFYLAFELPPRLLLRSSLLPLGGFLCWVRFLRPRFGFCFFLRAGFLQALLQNRNQIDYLGRLGRFLWFFFDFFSTGFNFFFDHLHERFAVVVFVFFGIPL